MRKIGIVVLVLLAVIVIAFLAPSLVDVNQFRGQIEAEAQQHLARPAKLGRMHLTLFPPAFRVDNASIGEDPRFGRGQFVQVQDLYLSLKLWPLLHKKIQIVSLDLRHPQIELIRNAEGVWNFSTLGHNGEVTRRTQAQPPKPRPQTQPATPQARQPEQESAFSLDHLRMTDGTIAITDYQKHQARTVYDHTDVDLSKFVPGRPFELSAAVHLPGKGKQVARLEGKIGPMNEQRTAATPIDAALKLNDVRLSDAQKFLNAKSLAGTDMVISGSVSVKNDNSNLISNGVVTLKQVRLKGLDLGYPIDADYKVSYDSNNDRIKIDKGNIRLGATPFSITGTVDAKAALPVLAVRLLASNASIAELARLTSSFGAAVLKPGMQVSGNLNADIVAQGPSNKPTLNGRLNATNLQINGGGAPQPVRASDVSLALTPQRIESNNFTAKIGDIPLAVQFAVGDYSGSTPQINATVRTSNADIGELLNTAKAYGVNGSNGIDASGALSLDAQVNGSLKNASALAFSGSGQIRDATVKTASLSDPVNVHNANLKFAPNSVTVDNLNASIGKTDVIGMLTVRDFALKADKSASNPQINAALRTTHADIAELLKIAKSLGVTAVDDIAGSGVLSLNVSANGPLKNTSALAFDGSGQMRDATLTTPSLTKPLNVRTANLKFTTNSVTLDNLNASIGGTNATGMISVRNFAAPAVQFTLSADKLNVAELQQLTAPAAHAKTSTRWSLVPQAHAQLSPAAQPSMLEKVTGGGKVAVGTVVYDQLVLSNLWSNVTLDHGIIKLSPLTAHVYGGQQSGTIILDARQTPPAVSVATNFQKVDANQLLSSTSSLKDTLYGLLSADGHTNFRAASADDIARTLNGKLSLNLVNGKLAHVDMLNQLAVIGKFALSGNQNAAQPFTDLVKLSGGFDINNGVAQTNNLQAVIEGGTVAAQGVANLVDQSLNMHLTAVLSKATSQKVGGIRIRGYMNTALENQNGELVIPVIVTGTLQKPQFAPDLEKIAQMKLQNLVPSASNPAEATTAILGQVLGKKGQQGGVGGIVGAVLGGEQQQNQEEGQQQTNQSVSNPQQSPQQQQNQQPQQQEAPQAQQQQPQEQQSQKKKSVLDTLGDILKKQQEQDKEKEKQQPPPQ